MTKVKKEVSPFAKYLFDKQVHESLRADAAAVEAAEKEYQDGDLVIAVLDRGWVFMGFVTRLPNERIRLDCAYNVHRWGTTEGLGQLCVKGPTAETVLNEAGTIYGKDIFIMKVDTSKWF